MAKGRFNCAQCGETVVIFERNRREADRKAAWHEAQKHICDDCRQKQLEAANQSAAEYNRACGLPELSGSEKQISWAETIRANIIRRAERVERYIVADELPEAGTDRHMIITDAEAIRGVDAEQLATLLTALKAQTRADWWIDHRDHWIGMVLKELLPAVTKPSATDQAAAEAIAEATVYPANPVISAVTEIRISGNKLQALLPEKNDDWRELVRFQLGYNWTGECWERAIGMFQGVAIAGTMADRAAELGHQLLAAGFPIRIFDERIREAASTGDYEPEHTRWVLRRTKGEYAGWFAIQWKRPDDFYAAAKKLSRARYDKPYVVVPAEHWDEVLDFAQHYGFRLTADARELGSEQQYIKERALVVDVQAPNRTGERGKTAPDKLDPNAATQDIDDALRDD